MITKGNVSVCGTDEIIGCRHGECIPCTHIGVRCNGKLQFKGDIGHTVCFKMHTESFLGKFKIHRIPVFTTANALSALIIHGPIFFRTLRRYIKRQFVISGCVERHTVFFLACLLDLIGQKLCNGKEGRAHTRADTNIADGNMQKIRVLCENRINSIFCFGTYDMRIGIKSMEFLFHFREFQGIKIQLFQLGIAHINAKRYKDRFFFASVVHGVFYYLQKCQIVCIGISDQANIDIALKVK